jgi:choline dehydrogenase-like flavoprotein
MWRTLVLLVCLCVAPIVSAHVERYDYVVVGAGTAGCIVASRLSENPDTRVLLLGLGDDESQSPWNVAPYVVAEPQLPLDVPRFADVTSSRENYVAYQASQNVLISHVSGGGSAISDAMQNRVIDADINRILSEGGFSDPAWNYASIMARWRRVENLTFTGTSYTGSSHGTNGPLQTVAVSPDFYLGTIMNITMEQAGISFTPDLGSGAGAGYTVRTLQSPVSPSNIVRTEYFSAYIKSVIAQRPNLVFVPGANVLSVSASPSCHSSAFGLACFDQVKYLVRDELITTRVYSGGEIILTAGALGTPKILFHSGVGDCAFLRTQGVNQCNVVLPQLGQAMRSHFQYYFVFGLFSGSPDWNQHVGAMTTSLMSMGRNDGQVNIDLTVAG